MTDSAASNSKQNKLDPFETSVRYSFAVPSVLLSPSLQELFVRGRVNPPIQRHV